MKNGKYPDPNTIHPIAGYDNEIYVKPTITNMPFKGDTVIGNDVWIGQNAMILPGIHISDGAIIGATSKYQKRK